jgi:hypothetical protein
MRRGAMRNLLLASRSPQPPQERSEPRLLDPNAPRSLDRPAGRSPAILPPTTDNRGRLPTAPVIAASDRPPTAVAEGPSGVPRHLAVAGSLAFALAGIGSAGFLLLTNPAKETGSVTPVSSSTPLETDRRSGSVAGDAALTHSAASSATPESPSGLSDASPPKSTDTSAAASAISPAAASQDSTDAEAPARVATGHAAAAAQPGPKAHPRNAPPQAPAVAAAKSASPTLPSAGAVPPPEKPVPALNPATAPARVADRHQRTETEPHPTPSTLSETHRLAQTRSVERHRHWRSGHEIRSSSVSGRTPPPVLRHPEGSRGTAQPSAPQQSAQAAAFAQLLQHLTGSVKPASQSSDGALSPPDPGTADPSAPHRPGGSSDQ